MWLLLAVTSVLMGSLTLACRPELPPPPDVRGNSTMLIEHARDTKAFGEILIEQGRVMGRSSLMVEGARWVKFAQEMKLGGERLESLAADLVIPSRGMEPHKSVSLELDSLWGNALILSDEGQRITRSMEAMKAPVIRAMDLGLIDNELGVRLLAYCVLLEQDGAEMMDRGRFMQAYVQDFQRSIAQPPFERH